ncbi:hypothetical protein [Hydrogenophaga sp. PAMC20947]|uniref:hypothetical protein n=1 Tax=Hydrogenophaga sp. PAMC20947 TaxID=2565558 RepID=UPI00109E0177|nr:hypothetical protein [Hydrogenophaga sp. PAMC20947]QCB48372.1 hypothetical protein E5678_21490 [Hydrogenophaga sp. PAMC20947]
MRTVFWRDMLVFGTVVNMLASFAALMVLAQQDHAGGAIALHFLPLPLNASLLCVVLRSPQRTNAVVAAAVGWFVAMLIA